MLTRHKAKPGCDIACAFETGGITNSSYDCGGTEWPDARDSQKAAGSFIGVGDGFDPLGWDCDAFFKPNEVFVEIGEKLTRQGSQIVCVVLKYPYDINRNTPAP